MAGETASGAAGDQDPGAESPSAEEQTPESFGKVEETGAKTVPLDRLKQVIGQRNSLENERKELAGRVEKLEAQLQGQPPQMPETGMPPVHRLDLRAEELRSKAKVARAEGDHVLADDLFVEAGKAESGNQIQTVLNAYTKAEQDKAEEYLWAQARNEAADRIGKEFPWMRDTESPERMKAFNVWNSNQWLKSSPHGEYYAAQQVALEMLNTQQLPGSVQKKPPVQLDAGAPRPTATGAQPNAKVELDELLNEKNPTLKKDGLLDWAMRHQPWKKPGDPLPP